VEPVKNVFKLVPAQILGKDLFAAKYCVSYLTQSKEVLTPEEGGQLGLIIFGCDTCQEVVHTTKKESRRNRRPYPILRLGVAWI
jgi:epoxyqueuosine reductase